jgi:hypothetical protein
MPRPQTVERDLPFDYEFNHVVLDPASPGEQRITTTVGYGF